jgi:hypothetical protein
LVKAKAHILPVFRPDGLLDSSFVDTFDTVNPSQHYLRISTSHGISKVIPMVVQYELHDIHVKNVEKSETITDIDFGEISADTGEKRKYVLHNPNPFRVKYEYVCTEKVNFILLSNFWCLSQQALLRKSPLGKFTSSSWLGILLQTSQCRKFSTFRGSCRSCSILRRSLF